MILKQTPEALKNFVRAVEIRPVREINQKAEKFMSRKYWALASRLTSGVLKDRSIDPDSLVIAGIASALLHGSPRATTVRNKWQIAPEVTKSRNYGHSFGAAFPCVYARRGGTVRLEYTACP